MINSSLRVLGVLIPLGMTYSFLLGCQKSDSLKPMAATPVCLAPTKETADSKQTFQKIPLLREVERVSKGTKYAPISISDMEHARRLFQKTIVMGREAASLEEDWRAIGFDLQWMETETNGFWLVTERSNHQIGRGAFAIRPDSTSHIFLQAPHCFYDEGTREISTSLFHQSDFRFAAWNTVHRKAFDLAHEPVSLFNEFMRTACQIDAKVCVVQLHGFAQSKHRSRNRASPDLIASNGSESPRKWLRSVTVRLAEAFPGKVILAYPFDTQELGATTNQQALLLNSMHASSFLHLEMSETIRSKMLNERSSQESVLKILKELDRSF